ncbi:long polar fimbrial protein LpfA, partial [Salmonella enterica subsp. enterica serovar Enteritidis]
MKKGLIAHSDIAVVSTSAFAAESRDGTIKNTGQNVDAPCLVSTHTQNQQDVQGQVKKNINKANGDKTVSKPIQNKQE